MEAVRRAVVAAGIGAQSYLGHSFQIGAATTAAAKGVPNSGTLAKLSLYLIHQNS